MTSSIKDQTEATSAEVLAQMSHDILNPLHVACGLAELLSTSPTLPPGEKKMANMLKSNVDQLQILIEKLLDFVQTLPADHPSPADKKINAPADRATGASSAKKHILIVEDHPANIQVMTSFLQVLGHDYDVAENGLAALDKFAASHYDMILMDIQMRGMDGLETARRIRAIEREKAAVQTPIIATTGNATEDDYLICKRAGIDDCLSKPFKLEDLKNKLNSW